MLLQLRQQLIIFNVDQNTMISNINSTIFKYPGMKSTASCFQEILLASALVTVEHAKLNSLDRKSVV